MRFGGGLGLLFNIAMCVVALISIMVTIPDRRDEHAERVATPGAPSFGS